MTTRRLYIIAAALIVLGLLLLVAAHLPVWFWHPLFGKGYQFWSGIGSDFGEATLIAGLITGSVAVRQFLHAHFECHVDTCHNLGVHPVHGTSYRTCWHHHPVLSQHEKHGVPLSVIHGAHKNEVNA